MGKQTIIRLKDRKNVRSIVRKTTNLVCVAVVIAASFIAYTQIAPVLEERNQAVHRQALAEILKDVPESVELKRYQGVQAPSRTFIAIGKPYDIRDPAVLLELTGRMITLTDDPVAAFPYSRAFDGPPEELPEIVIIERKKPEAPKPVDVRRITPKKPSGKTNGTNGGKVEPDPVEPDPPEVIDEDPDEINDSPLSADALGVYRAASTQMDEADQIFETWKSTSDSGERNKIFIRAQKLYEGARDMLRPLIDQYPNVEMLSTAISRALRGRFDCAKLRTA